jgi:quinol monooxygenase YgiN
VTIADSRAEESGRNDRQRRRGAARAEERIVYARSTTVRAQHDSMDRGIAYVGDEVLPAVMTMEGCLGLSMLVDRDSGECVITTSWDSQKAMHATAELGRPFRDRAVEVLSGAAAVQEWETAVMHRRAVSRPGSPARSNWMAMDPDGMDRSIEGYRLTVLPRLEEIGGLCSASLMVDRATGMSVSTVVFDSDSALKESRSTGDTLRKSLTLELGAKLLDVHEYELALAHLHLPEMA